MIPERTEKMKQGIHDLIDYIGKENCKNMTIIEIGCWTGAATQIFSKHFQKVICVDPWAESVVKGINPEDAYKVFMQRVGRKENVEIFRDYSYNVIGKTKRADIVYIDGAHDYESVKKDIVLYKDICNKYIAGHDYWQKKFDGVIKAVNEMCGKPDKIFSDTSWIKAV